MMQHTQNRVNFLNVITWALLKILDSFLQVTIPLPLIVIFLSQDELAMTTNSGCVNCMAFNHNGHLLVTGAADGMIRIFGELSQIRAQFHRAAKQLILCLLYVFHFIALLTVKHRERHANLPAVIARKWVMQQYKSMVNAHAPLWIFLLTCEIHCEYLLSGKQHYDIGPCCPNSIRAAFSNMN